MRAQRLVCFCEDEISTHFRAGACWETIKWFVKLSCIADGTFAHFSADKGGFSYFLRSLNPFEDGTFKFAGWSFIQNGGERLKRRGVIDAAAEKLWRLPLRCPAGDTFKESWVCSQRVETCKTPTERTGKAEAPSQKTGGLWLISGNAEALFRNCGQSAVSGTSLHLFWKYTKKFRTPSPIHKSHP